MPKYSVITPAYIFNEERAELFKKCIESVNRLDYDHTQYQHLIVNDGSPYPFDLPAYPHIKVINQNNLQRITAYNKGLEASTGDIILFLDSDDEFERNTLSSIDKAFKKYPKYKMFNFGSTMLYTDGKEALRDPFMPKKRKVGHEVFGGGNIVNGTFVFKREVYEDLGGFMPELVANIDCTVLNYPAYSGQEKPYIRNLIATSPYDFSAYMQLKYPEIQKYFMVKHPDHPTTLVRELGNPYGQDYALFYAYTRKYHSKPVKEYLLRVHLK